MSDFERDTNVVNKKFEGYPNLLRMFVAIDLGDFSNVDHEFLQKEELLKIIDSVKYLIWNSIGFEVADSLEFILAEYHMVSQQDDPWK